MHLQAYWPPCFWPHQLTVNTTGYVSTPAIAGLQTSLTFQAGPEILHGGSDVHV